MQSGSYWAYREAGAFCEEPDDYEPERRTRCTCGAFLPKESTHSGGIAAVVNDYGDFNPWTGEWEPALVEDEEVIEPTTACGKCGKIWTETDLWR